MSITKDEFKEVSTRWNWKPSVTSREFKAPQTEYDRKQFSARRRREDLEDELRIKREQEL